MNHNPQLLRDVLLMMGREAPRLSSAFRSAIHRGDAKEARRAVHTLKSNCRHFDLKVVSEFAQQLEEMILTESLDQLMHYDSAVSQIGEGITQWVEKLLEGQE